MPEGVGETQLLSSYGRFGDHLGTSNRFDFPLPHRLGACFPLTSSRRVSSPCTADALLDLRLSKPQRKGTSAIRSRDITSRSMRTAVWTLHG